MTSWIIIPQMIEKIHAPAGTRYWLLWPAFSLVQATFTTSFKLPTGFRLFLFSLWRNNFISLEGSPVGLIPTVRCSQEYYLQQQSCSWIIPVLLATSAVLFFLLSYASAAVLGFIWDQGHDLSVCLGGNDNLETLPKISILAQICYHRISPWAVTETLVYWWAWVIGFRPSWRSWWPVVG